MLLPNQVDTSPLALVRSGCLMSSAVELRPGSLTVLILVLEFIVVPTVKMLGRGVSLAPKEPSDFVEAMPLVDVWRSATTMTGAECVVMGGTTMMLKWHADSWD